MAAEGGQVIHGDRRSRKLAVVVAVQNVLVAACLVVTLYVYWTVRQRVNSTQAAGQNAYIQAEVYPDITSTGTLRVYHIYNSFKMSMLDDRIHTNCTGSYLLSLYTCYTTMDKEKESTAELQLKRGSRALVSSFSLKTTCEVCREFHSITYLRAEQEISLHLSLSDNFKLKNMTVDLSFLQGGRCET